jgi:hypothetical protein
MTTLDELRAAGFTEEEILADAGFSPEEIQAELKGSNISTSGIQSGIDASDDMSIIEPLKNLLSGVARSIPTAIGGIADLNPFQSFSRPPGPSNLEMVEQALNKIGLERDPDSLAQRIGEYATPFLPGAKIPQMIGGAGAALGEYFGKKAAPESSLVQTITSLLGGVAGGGLASGGRYLGRKTFGIKTPAEEVLTRPAVSKALDVAERSDYLPVSREKIKTITPKVGEAISEVAAQADPENLAKSIMAQLEVGAKSNALYQKQAANFSESLPVLMKKGVFDNATSVDDMAEKVSTRLKEIGIERQTTVDKLQRGLIALNRGTTKTKDITGIIMPKDVTPAVKELRTRIAKLRTTESAEPIANAIEKQMNSILRDIAPKVDAKGNIRITTPTAALQMTQNLNEVRKVLLKEFNALNQAKALSGDVITHTQGSIEAISKLQKALYKAIENKLSLPAIKRNLGVDPKIFNKLNEEYGALKSFEDVLDSFGRETMKKRVPKDLSAIPTFDRSGFKYNLSLSPKGNIVSGLSRFFNRQETPQALKMAQYARGRETAPMQNIADLISLSKTPIDTSFKPSPSYFSPATMRALIATLQE